MAAAVAGLMDGPSTGAAGSKASGSGKKDAVTTSRDLYTELKTAQRRLELLSIQVREPRPCLAKAVRTTTVPLARPAATLSTRACE
jgi:hypothetical protein